MTLKQGSLFTLSHGEYSDYVIIALCRATEDIDIEALREEYMELYPEQREEYEFSPYQFANWLVNVRRSCEEVEYFYWHIGNYGTAYDMPYQEYWFVGEPSRLNEE